MDANATAPAWPPELSGYRLEGSEIVAADFREEDKPGRDSLGNPGRVLVVRHDGRLAVRMPRARAVELLVRAGLVAVRDTTEETELAEPRRTADALADDPFLIERLVNVTVRGRDLPARQREAIETKVAALRRETGDPHTSAPRRAAAEAMIRDLSEGLVATIDVRTVGRRFRPAVSVKDPVESIGSVVRLRAGSRIVYRVGAAKPEAGDDRDAGDASAMVFHVVGLGAREAVLLYTGGVHGQRHLRDLESSPVHHAWFANRERVKTEAAAPWIGRKVLRELKELGHSEIVVEKRRDVHPVAIDRVGSGTHALEVDGGATDVPVIRCRTAPGDELVVLDDEENPLVLRLEERGAELLRTIDAVHSEPLHPVVTACEPETAVAV